MTANVRASKRQKPNLPHGTSGSRVELAGLVVAGLWLVPCVLSLLSNQGTAQGRYLGNVASLLFAPLFMLLAIALGDWLLIRVFRTRKDIPGRWLFASGLGIGLLATVTFIIGLIVVPPAWTAWLAAIIVSAVLRMRIGKLLAAIRKTIVQFVARRNWVEIALVFVIAVLLFLNLLQAFIPPVEYDEMEYHLAAPAKYVRDGHISFISNNVYASFPANIEMLFLDAMVMRGGVIEGLALGRLINVLVGLMAACAMAACAGALFDKRAAVPAAAIFYTWPCVNSFAIVGYVELGIMLYGALAVLVALEYRRSGRAMRHLVLLGLMCGLAASCKHPSVLFVCVPATVWMIVSAGRKMVPHTLLFGVIALAVFSPWMIRNTINTGNPFYPLLGSVFDSPLWSARKEARWVQAHEPGESVRSAGPALREAIVQRDPLGPQGMSWLLVVFIPFVFFRREWRGNALVLFLLIAFAVVAWLTLTHRIQRFIVPWLVPLVLLNAAGAVAFAERKKLNAVFGIVLIALACVEARAVMVGRSPAAGAVWLFGHMDIDAALVAQSKRGWNYNHDAIMFINKLPPGSRTLFYGEALTLYCTADIVAPTVFDENPLDEIVRGAKSAEDIRDKLRALGVTHIYVNLDELYRLQWSYAFRYGGKQWHGCSTLFDGEEQKERLRTFLTDHCLVAFPGLSQDRYRRYIRGEFLSVLGSREKNRPPHKKWDEEPQVLPGYARVCVPVELLPPLPPEAGPVPRWLPDALVPYVWSKLQTVVYEIVP